LTPFFHAFLIFQIQQGSAADVAMLAMLEISNNKQLKELGWKLLLQVNIYAKYFLFIISILTFCQVPFNFKIFIHLSLDFSTWMLGSSGRDK
jgi:hypothetical protein